MTAMDEECERHGSRGNLNVVSSASNKIGAEERGRSMVTRAKEPRSQSHDSFAYLRRSDSLRSLRAFAQLIDARSGYYEEARKSESELREIKNSNLREYYTRQNEILDGWREVDEVLESQFPMEVMRRFARPDAPELALHGSFASSQMHADVPIRIHHSHDEDETDEEGETIWTHPFSQNSSRRQRRASARALSSLSGFFAQEPSKPNDYSLRSELVAESLKDLSTSLLSDSMRVQEEESFAQSSDESPSAGEAQPVDKPKRTRTALRQLLAQNPVMQSEAKQPSPAPRKATTSEEAPLVESPKPAATPEYGAVVPAQDNALKDDKRKSVWTKADHERHKLLQIVPTHRRRVDMDSYVQFYININLLINLVLLIGKLVAVLSSNSVSLLASLIDSALDLLCTVVIYTATQATAYRSWHTFYHYPVGKRRLEPLGVLIFSVLMVVSFLQVLLESVSRLWSVLSGTADVEPGLPVIGIVFMALTIVIKTIMWLLCRNSKSSSVRAISLDSETDAIFNIFSLVFPLLDQFFGSSLLDSIGGTVLSLYIISEWVSTLTDTTSKLTGKVASAADASRCLYLVSRFSLVQAISGFELYHAGDNMVAEVDVVLPMSFNLKEAHDLGEIITYCIESLPEIERAYIVRIEFAH